MPSRRISELDAATSIEDSDLVEISQAVGGGYVSKRLLGSLLKSYCQKYRTIIFSIAYEKDVSIGTNKAPSFIIPISCTIDKAFAYSRTAPTGSDLIFDVNKNGVTIWSNQANRLKVLAGANTGSQTVFDTTQLFENDRIDIDVDQIGSGTAGRDITIEIRVIT